MTEMRWLQKEHFRMLLLNTKHHVLAIPTISIGSLSAAIVHPREVFREAIRSSAAAIILAHNHPSGDPTPSAEDTQLTKRLVEIGKLMDITVLDHIIIGDGRYLSMKEKGIL
jgi:DNA repair protein RadC